MSVFDAFAAPAMAFLTGTVGETCEVTPKGGSPKKCGVIVLRDELQTRGTDKNARVDYSLIVQILKAEYPGGVVNVGGDTVTVKVRTDDARPATKTVSSIVSSVGSMWTLKLD